VEANNFDEQLAAALSETARLRSENERLRKLLRIRECCPQVVLASEMDAKAPVASSFSSDEKVRLFRVSSKDARMYMRCDGRG
jgi:regulator of replication initiation timing